MAVFPSLADRLRPAAVSALIAWTGVCWLNRIPLLWTDEAVSVNARLVASLPIVVFVALGAATAARTWTRTGPLGRRGRGLARVLAWWSIAYWTFAWLRILLGDHPVGFIVVHTVLAGGAVALSVWVLGRVRAPRRSGSSLPEAGTLPTGR